MAKIWRRKRKGKEIGSFHVLVGGKPVNLQTQNAKQANARAKLALAGKWPDSSADDAAEVAAPLEHAEAAAAEADAEAAPVVPSKPEPAGAAPIPPAAPAGEPDPIAAAVAAAAESDGAPVPDAAAEELGDLSAQMGAELRRVFLSGGEGGVDANADLGEVGAAVLIGIEFEIGQALAARRGKVIPEPQKSDFLFRATAAAVRVLASNLADNINVHPGYVLAGALLLYPVQMALTARPAPAAPAATGPAGDAVS